MGSDSTPDVRRKAQMIKIPILIGVLLIVIAVIVVIRIAGRLL